MITTATDQPVTGEDPNTTAMRRILKIAGVSDQFIDDVMLPRVRSMERVLQLEDMHMDFYKKKAMDLDIEFDYIELEKIVAAIKFSIYTQKKPVEFLTVTEEEINTLIGSHSRYLHGVKTLYAPPTPRTPANSTNIRAVADGNIDSPSDGPSNESINHHTKRNLTNIESEFPKKPITAKEMKDFKIDFLNEMRSMGLSYLFADDFAEPTNEARHKKFLLDSQFAYSALLKVTKGHEAREWLLSDDLLDDGRASWFKLIDQYDVKEKTGSYLSDAVKKLSSLTLHKDHVGAASSYLTNFSALMTEIAVHGKPYPDCIAKELFLNSITHPKYYETVTMLKLSSDENLDLNTCMNKIQIISGSIERDAEKTRRRVARTSTSDSSSSGGGGSLPAKYMGKEIDAKGNFKDVEFYKNLSYEDRGTYFKKKDSWRAAGLIPFNNSSRRNNNGGGGGKSHDKKYIKKIISAYEESKTSNSSGDDNGNMSENSPTGSESNDIADRTVALLQSRNNKTRSVRYDEKSIRKLKSLAGQYNTIGDNGADTCLLGSAFTMISYSNRRAMVHGFDEDLSIGEKKIGTGVTAFDKDDGTTIIVCVNEAIDHTSQPSSMLSINQMRHYGIDVCDVHPKFISNGSKGRFSIMAGNHEIPFYMDHGLAAITFRPPTEEELDTCDWVTLTSDAHWDPAVLEGYSFTPMRDEHVARKLEDAAAARQEHRYPTRGSTRAKNRSGFNNVTTVHKKSTVNDKIMGSDFSGFVNGESEFSKTVYDCLEQYAYHELDASEVKGKKLSCDDMEDLQCFINNITTGAIVRRRDEPPDWNRVQACMGYAPLENIKRTWFATTQMAKEMVGSAAMSAKEHLKARFPQLNRRRLYETYATDTWFASEKAVTGEKCCQLFVGHTSTLTFCYGMKTESEGASKLEEFIKEVGAPSVIKSDNSKMQTGKAFSDLCQLYNIGQETTEPYHKWQNEAERRIQTIKSTSNRILDRSGAPDSLWLRAVTFTCMLLNVMAKRSLNWRTPMEVGLGVTPDISAFIQFTFFEPVYYIDPTPAGYPETNEKIGYWCGPAESVGDTLTSWVYTRDTNELIARSVLRSAVPASDEGVQPVNFRSYFEGNVDLPVLLEGSPEVDLDENRNENRLVSLNDTLSELHGTEIGSKIDPENLVGFSYARKKDGTSQRCVVQSVDENNEQVEVEYLNGSRELVEYNEIINQLNAREEDGDGIWSFKKILNHRPLKGKRNQWEVLVDWDQCNSTWEPLSEMRAADQITLANYAKENNLLDLQGWKWAKSKEGNPKKFIRMAKILKSQVKDLKARYKFGILVPRSCNEALSEDNKNNNTLWDGSLKTEIGQLDEYSTFKVLARGEKAPEGYKRIPGFFVFDVKHDLRRKARFVAGGHMTVAPKEDNYSGVVEFESVKLILFLAELNGLALMAADVGNAYLHAWTREKVYIIAGPEFGKELEGRVMIIQKSLYGLTTSAARWHEELSTTLLKMGFVPSKADSDVWMKDCGSHYEYLCTWVDDLIVAAKDPSAILKEFEDYGYKLKGVGEPEYYLGGDFGRIKSGLLEKGSTCYISAQTYIGNVSKKIEEVLDVRLRNYQMPMDPDYRPEVDDSELLSPEMGSKYRMLVGSALWATTLGRYDVMYAVSTLARYNAMPREGHLQAMLRVFGYLKGFSKAKLVFDTRDFIEKTEDVEVTGWKELYPNAEEEMPPDMPVAKMKPVNVTGLYDASHAPCLVTRRSVTGIVLMVNNTVLRCTTKRQNTVESATYGAEMVAGRLAVEQVMDLRYRLRMLGVPVDGASVLVGDNQSVITSCSLPSSNLKKRHNAIAYHRIREAVAAGIVKLRFVKSEYNLADALTKALSGGVHYNLWKNHLLKPLRDTGEYQHFG